MPRFPKPPGARQGHRGRKSVEVGRIATVPTPPAGLSKTHREDWTTYWESDVARAARPVHVPVVSRLFVLRNERDEGYRKVRRDGHYIGGSQGQPVLNPMLRRIAECDAEIRQLEDRLGLNPRSMALLGAHFAAAQRSLEDLDQDALAENDDVDDPRVLRIPTKPLKPQAS